jgi:triacylglycerol lipase
MRLGTTTLVVLSLSACHTAMPGSETDPASPDATAQVDSSPQTEVAYPIVLAHGLFGFQSLGPLDYFYGIHDALTAQGRVVFAPRVDAVQSPDVRGAQLVAAIEDAKKQTGAKKVIVIGHSQGGLDARWAAMHDADSIAAVVTVATPHRGSPVADVAFGILPGDSTAALDVLATFFGVSTAGSSTSFQGAMMALSSAGAAQFNALVPDVPGMPYYSIAGRSNYAHADACIPAAADFMATWDGSVDPLKVELAPVAAILAAAVSPATPTQDGLVTVDSATWGTFLGCIPADHLDEVCQIAGQSPGLDNSFDCLEFWKGLNSYLVAHHL